MRSSSSCPPRVPPPRLRSAWIRIVGRAALAAAVAALLPGCDLPAPVVEPIFLAGRAVEPDGDSLLAVVARNAGAVVLYDRTGRVRDTLGLGVLENPGQVQMQGDAWYVSDLEAGKPVIVVLGRDGAPSRRVSLAGTATQPHQFAVLPDGGIVVEGTEGRLLVVRGDSVATFAVVEVGTRPSLVLGTGGGVLHAIPDQTITLYNGFGNIRWRVEWPWAQTAFVSAIGEDTRGRIHFLAGVERDNTFIAYSMTPGTGEVVWWSEPQAEASFVVDGLGKLTPAKGRWADP